MKVDLIIKNGLVMTMEGKGVGLIEDGAIAIKGNTIQAVGSTFEITRDYKTEREIDAKDKLVMPGLIDAHIHTGLALLRGVAQDISHWMQKGLWPFMKHVTTDDSKKGSMVNIIEGIQAGTTTFCDYDRSMINLVDNFIKIGARARVAELVNEIPDNIGDVPVGELYPFYPEIGEQKLANNLTLIEKYHESADGRITCILGPHGPDMLSVELLKEMKALAEKYDTKLHMHVAQGDREIDQMVKRYGKRSIAFLEEMGYLNDRLIAVHLTEATDKETEIVAKSGAGMVYCSGSIGIIDGLVPPVLKFIESGGIAGLGSDQAPGNNCNNMFNEMKFAAILNKIKRSNPTVFPAALSLRLATIDAAKVMGIDHEVGSLRKGKKADIIIINMLEPTLSPLFIDPIRNIIPNLVYSARGHEVETSIIDGEIIMENRQITTINTRNVILEAQQAAKEVSIRAKKDILHAKSEMLQMMEEGLL
ncbi:amidohydrolase family protein [Neobacillus kokaensis]|uniref:N-ethylammeline chlorohydrolase n=1 Tax=Neobacillus kokaensis TaxID=2759023 RepID=A0ABQ3N627_9BACI|nr:amidohydrolase [Neobacillus kokaensis]GHH98982.1 N-ethylammeline chlorohydrolase [Neobacillus kokaensis]